MTRLHIVLVSGLVLLLSFALASYLYRSDQADRIEAIAGAIDSPLERPHSHGKGPADAEVVLIEFFDPACETCRAFDPFVKKILATHPDTVRLVVRYAPFHRGSETMVKILEAAALQGRFWEVLDVMYRFQPQWASHHNPRPEKIWEFLPRAGVDVERIQRDMNDIRFVEIIEQDLADGRALGVTRTPQFFVNGKPLQSFGYAQLQTLLESEIAKQYPQ